MFPSTPPRSAASAAAFSTPDRPTRPSTVSIKAQHERAIFQRALEEAKDDLKVARAGGPTAERGTLVARLAARVTQLEDSIARIEAAHRLYPRPS